MTILKENRLAVIIGAIFVTALLLIGYASGLYVKLAGASAPSGLPTTFATTSTASVGPHKPNVASSTVTVFGARTNCSSRVISTFGSPILLMFSESMISSTTANPTASYGVLQLASTTVVYDSGQYGCGFVSGYGHSTTSITVLEFR